MVHDIFLCFWVGRQNITASSRCDMCNMSPIWPWTLASCQHMVSDLYFSLIIFFFKWCQEMFSLGRHQWRGLGQNDFNSLPGFFPQLSALSHGLQEIVSVVIKKSCFRGWKLHKNVVIGIVKIILSHYYSQGQGRMLTLQWVLWVCVCL